MLNNNTQEEKITGIYKIENTESHKLYIGRSRNIKLRWKQHLSDLEDHKHHSFKLQNDYDNASDKTIFKFEIVEQISNVRDLKKKEQYYINLYHSYENGYNACPFADNPKYITNASSDPKLLVNKRQDMQGMDEKFIKIPREIIEMKDLYPIRIPTYIYLASWRTLFDCVLLCLDEVVFQCGYIPNRNKGKINDKVVAVLNIFESRGLFKISNSNYAINKPCILDLNINCFDVPTSYAIIFKSELQKMREYKSNLRNVSYDKLLLILCYIRVNKLRRSEYQQNNSHKKKPEFFYRQIKTMADDTALSDKTVSACIAALNSLNIIVSRPMPRYKDKYDHWHTDVTLFVDKTGNWEDELKWGEEFLLNNKALHNDSVQRL